MFCLKVLKFCEIKEKKYTLSVLPSIYGAVYIQKIKIVKMLFLFKSIWVI